MTRRVFFAAALLAAATLVSAQEKLEPLHGTCSITASEKSDRVRFETERGDCNAERRDCGHNNMDVRLTDLSGFSIADLEREGASLEATLNAEAGTLKCAGTVHDSALRGDYTFTPNEAFVTHMQQLGFSGFDSEKLQAYTLFHIDTAWVQALQSAGVQDMDSGNLIALRIFRITPEFVRSMDALGYPHLPADKLIAFGVHGVNPDEVKQVRALGYNPNADELIQMRIFRVTPDFIRRMQDRGFKNLSIAKLVQVKIFKLAE